MSLQIVKSFGLDFIHIFCQTLNIKKRFTKRISFLSLSNQETDLEYWHIQDFGFCRFEILKQKDFYRGHSFQHNSWMNPKSKIILCDSDPSQSVLWWFFERVPWIRGIRGIRGVMELKKFLWAEKRFFRSLKKTRQKVLKVVQVVS